MSELDLSVHELSKELQDAIATLRTETGLEQTGIVTRVGDGVAFVYGLRDCGYNEVLEIEATDGGMVEAFALNLLEDEIGSVILGEDSRIVAGARVRLSGKVLSVPVGPEMIGRVVDPLGRPLDGQGPIMLRLRAQ
jgi:F-type H+-transporting ATPase subunit alpha